MSRTFRRNNQFKRELNEAMVIDPCRRAQEHNDMVKAVRDWFVETNEPIQSANAAILPENSIHEETHV